MTRVQRILARGLLVFFGFLFVEGALRIGGVSFPIFDAYDHDRMLKLMPGKEGRYEKEGSGYLKINSLGYRDDEHARAKPDNVFRIAVLGDSFTEARQVELEETYWKQVETQLNEELTRAPRAGLTRVEVMGFGIGGYGQAEELMTLKLDVLDFRPDLVMVGFFGGNDLVNNLRSLSVDLRGESIRPFYVLEEGKLVLDESYREATLSRWARRFLLTATHYLRTFEVVNQIRRQWVVRRIQAEQKQRAAESAVEETSPVQVVVTEMGVRAGQYDSTPDPEWESAWQVTEALLAAMKREAAAIGAAFVVTTVSSAAQVDPDPSVRAASAQRLGVSDLLYPERRLAEIATRQDFTLIPLVERMQAEADQQGIYFHGFENTTLGKGHWNRAAHSIASEIVASEIAASGLLGALQ